MTQEEKDRIFNQLYELEERHPAFAENVRDNAYCEAITDVKRIIEGIKEQPSLPSNLDRVAVKKRVKEIFDALPKYNISEEQKNRVEFGLLALEAFAQIFYDLGKQTGAEWMAKQMMNTKSETE